MKKNILIVDDDIDFAMMIRDLLTNYGYVVEMVSSCKDAYAILTNQTFHLILLDINLPDGTGFDVCKELRNVSQIPIIFASARSNVDDKINGLDIGGDDYLAKPYSLKELLSRVNALIRRVYKEDTLETIYKLNQIEVHMASRRVFRNGNELKLTLKEFDLLAYLCANANRIIKKEELLHEVWGSFSEVELATITVHIRWLREKLEDDPSQPMLIKTVWGVGYILDEQTL